MWLVDRSCCPSCLFFFSINLRVLRGKVVTPSRSDAPYDEWGPGLLSCAFSSFSSCFSSWSFLWYAWVDSFQTDGAPQRRMASRPTPSLCEDHLSRLLGPRRSWNTSSSVHAEREITFHSPSPHIPC